MKLTPMMQQYIEIKERYRDCILFFRMGDFYEMFFEDALVSSKILGITLTTREKNRKDPIPMCGVPYHAASQYIAKLLQEGHKVAVCEQVEDSDDARGIVRREVTKVVTPGVPVDGEDLEPKEYNYLLSLQPNRKRWGIAYVDPTTGDSGLTEITEEEELESELNRINPKELLLPKLAIKTPIPRTIGRFLKSPFITYMDDSLYNYKISLDILRELFGKNWLQSFEHKDFQEGLTAAGVLLHYLRETQRRRPVYVKIPVIYRVREYMALDPMTRRNLELMESIRRDSTSGSLLWVLDRTKTAMGGRKLREYLSFPLIRIAEIRERLDAVEELKDDKVTRKEIAKELSGIYDLERLVNKITLKTVRPKDLISLKESLKRIPRIKSLLKDFHFYSLRNINNNIGEHEEIVELLDRAIVCDPPLTLREGGVINDGYNRELDELRDVSKKGKEWILRIEKEERIKTGINSLKVGYNKVFGYYIEITKTNLSQVPENFIRKQTLANAERFITPELKDYETRVLNANERIIELEKTLFEAIVEKIAQESKAIQDTASFIGKLDVLVSIAQVADERGYIKPDVNDGDKIHILDGRHPVVEAMHLPEGFVPNDTLLDCSENQLLVITGPNMAGKSTYIRQVALIVLMAQIGCFVPANKATIGIVDRIFARIGAMDDISRGQSTFMVEMSETAHILRFATKRSLIVLDEIGRGTSTFDGISIAWAVAEYIHDNPSLGARTLFATHYHELTELSLTKERVKNFNVSVKEWNERIIFLRKIISGSTNRSYGIQVARLAGIPGEVVKRAKSILANLEKEELDYRGMPRFVDEERLNQYQLNLFSNIPNPVIEELKRLDIDSMTPLDALNKIHHLKMMAEGKMEKGA